MKSFMLLLGKHIGPRYSGFSMWENKISLWQKQIVGDCFIGHPMKGWLGAWECFYVIDQI